MRNIPALFRSDFFVLNTTGPGLLSRTYAENSEAKRNVTILFPDDVCDAQHWHQFGQYGVHLMDGSWRPERRFIRARLARWWESWARERSTRESAKLGPNRHVGTVTTHLSSALAIE